MSNLTNPAFGIYVHIPFCRHQCGYCDFYKTTERNSQVESRLYAAYQAELAYWRQYLGVLNGEATVFVGGGTPSQVFHDPRLLPFWDQLNPSREWTFECNPQDLVGFNQLPLVGRRPGCRRRLSVGIQSMNQAYLNTLDRQCTVQINRQALSNFRKIAPDWELSVDLIVAVNSGVRNIQQELSDLLEYRPDHWSIYFLGLAKTHRLAPLLAPETQAEAEFFAIHDFLAKAGYEHYEISNYARPGCRSLHNDSYWLRRPYLGIGPSAHACWLIDNQTHRWSNISSIQEYCNQWEQGSQPQKPLEILTTDQENLETLYLGLRRSDGLVLPSDVVSKFRGLLEEKGEGRVGCTLRGWMVLDGLVSRLSPVLDKLGFVPKLPL